MPGNDRDVALGTFEEGSEALDERLVGGAFDGGRRKPYLKNTVADPGDRRAARARRDADRYLHRRLTLRGVGRALGIGLPVR